MANTGRDSTTCEDTNSKSSVAHDGMNFVPSEEETPTVVTIVPTSSHDIETPVSAKDDEDSKAEKESVQNWLKFINTNHRVGIITLIYMHNPPHENGITKGFVKGGMLLMIIAQLAIPFILFGSKIHDYDKGVCPSTATASQRALAFFICSIYVIKLSFASRIKKFKYDQGDGITFRSDAKLNVPLALDLFMDMAAESVVYFLSVWLVFLTKNELEMVLNALAIEFVLCLDDELKVQYLSLYPPNEDTVCAYRRENNEFPDESPRVMGDFLSVGVRANAFVSLGVLRLVTLFTFAAWIYLPVCKF